MSIDVIINKIKNDNLKDKAREEIERVARIWDWNDGEMKLIKLMEINDSVIILIETNDSVHQFSIEEEHAAHKPISKILLKIIFDNIELN